MSEKGKRWVLQAVVPCTKARSLLWHLFSLDTAYLEVADHHEPFEKPGAHLFWVLSGHGTLETDGDAYLLQPGHGVWFVDMTKVRTYAPAAGQTLVKRGIRFGGPALENWHKELGGSKQAQFDLKDAAPLHQAFRDLWRICRRKASGWEWKVHLFLTEMLGTLLNSRDALSPNSPDLPGAVMRVLNAVDAKPHYDWRVKELASIAGVSYSGLRTLFFEVMGENLHAYVQRRRLEHAQLLLSDPGLSVKQVAEQMDFSSEFYFSHFFKTLKGISPRAYRERQRGRR
ncbi:MAG TPA: AraC family transcriptional regulator [Verrucomicrobiota bacterium]|nr:AraC family transcriptional regulator [Verrucomicrobiota bacterium]